MLFTTIEQIKKELPSSASFDLKKISPFISMAERDFIIPHISQAQYDALEAKVSENKTLDTDETNLLAKIRTPLAFFAFYLWIPTGNVDLSSMGITQKHTTNAKPAFQWAIKNLSASNVRAAWMGMERLLEFLEENKATYTIWAASDQYTIFKEAFIHTATQFSKHFNIGDNRRTFMAIKSVMMRVEHFSILPVVYKTLYDKLRTQDLANSLSAANVHIMDTFIKPAVAHLTMGRAILELSMEISSRGITLRGSSPTIMADELDPAAQETLRALQETAISDGNAYLSGLQDYISSNLSDFPDYTADESYSASTDRTFTTPSDSKVYGLLG